MHFVHGIPNGYREGICFETKFALVIGAGAAGFAFGHALRGRAKEDWRIALTRRSSEAVHDLKQRLAAADWRIPKRAAVFPLDPSDEQQTMHLVGMLAGHGKFDLVVLAAGQAILDDGCDNLAASYDQNFEANMVAKSTPFQALVKQKGLARNAKVVVVSSRVCDFASHDPRIATQQGYYASIMALEGWATRMAAEHKDELTFEVLRMPLIVSSTAVRYQEEGVVPADYSLVDPLVYANQELNRILGPAG